MIYAQTPKGGGGGSKLMGMMKGKPGGGSSPDAGSSPAPDPAAIDIASPDYKQAYLEGQLTWHQDNDAPMSDDQMTQSQLDERHNFSDNYARQNLSQ